MLSVAAISLAVHASESILTGHSNELFYDRNLLGSNAHDAVVGQNPDRAGQAVAADVESSFGCEARASRCYVPLHAFCAEGVQRERAEMAAVAVSSWSGGVQQ